MFTAGEKMQVFMRNSQIFTDGKGTMQVYVSNSMIFIKGKQSEFRRETHRCSHKKNKASMYDKLTDVDSMETM